MRVALVTVYSRPGCTLKDVAGGFGTRFHVGRSVRARLLEWAKSRIVRLPSPVLGYLARYGREAGHEIVPVDLVRHGRSRTPVPECDLAVVLTSMTDATAEREVLRELRATGAHTIAVGAHATACPSVYEPVADAVVVGDPEHLGARLFDRQLRGRVPAGYVRDLDSLPFPDWNGFPVESYRYAFLASRGPILPVWGVRGCAFGCDYCPFRTAPFRQRRVHHVVEEVRYLKKNYGVQGLAFRDPLFNLEPDRVFGLAEGLGPLDVRFSAEMRADLLTPDQLRCLADAGLRSLEIGVESVDRAMLQAHKRRPPSARQIETVVETAHQLGIRVVANFMLGLPEDTEANIRATVEWAKQLNPFAVQFTVATPYPGTKLADEVELRRKTDAPDTFTGWEPLFDHPTIPTARLRELREWAYVSYHTRPRYLWRFARQASSALLD